MNITLQIMINAPSHILLTAKKTAMRHKNGDIIDLIPTDELADLVGGEYRLKGEIRNPRFSFIHCIKFPSELGEMAKRKITEQIKVTNDCLRLSRYRVLFSKLSPQVRKQLSDQREITMTWIQAKRVIRKKVITDALDPSKDDETISIIDADLL